MGTQKNKLKLIVLIIASIAVVVFVATIILSNSTENNLEKELELGEKYLSEFNYDEAISAFTRALVIEPNDESAKSGMLAFLMA